MSFWDKNKNYVWFIWENSTEDQFSNQNSQIFHGKYHIHLKEVSKGMTEIAVTSVTPGLKFTRGFLVF